MIRRRILLPLIAAFALLPASTRLYSQAIPPKGPGAGPGPILNPQNPFQPFQPAFDPATLATLSASISDREILASINAGVDALLPLVTQQIADLKAAAANNGQTRKRPNGLPFFMGGEENQLGQISLAVYALLTVGRVTGDPRLHFSSKEMNDAVQFLLTARPRTTYTVALQASALALLPNRPEFRKPLLYDRDELLRGATHARFTYSTVPASSPANNNLPKPSDNSNTQYGQLGLWACQDAGLEVPSAFWEEVDQHWRSTELAPGGWSYQYVYPPPKNLMPIPTMTCAGVASLFLAKDYLDQSVERISRTDKCLDAGIKWLADNFAAIQSQISGNLYLAYGLERVALAGGIKTLGDHDWYREGAVLVLHAQHPDGTWIYNSPTVGTSFALLFLARGLAPVAVGKLQYDGPWDARSRDCARFVHWFYKTSERPLNWQTVNLNSDPEEWKNVPVLVITGYGDPKFTKDQLDKLRRYVLNGGLIFSSADESDATFTKLIRQKYAPALFNNTYEMRAVPPDHPFFQLDYKTPKAKQPRLFSLSNGDREVWVHSADDIAASWQSYSTAKNQNFEVPTNIYSYAVGRTTLPPTLDPLTPPTPPAPVITYNIARLSYAGNWDPEPAAWQHFAQYAALHYSAALHIFPTKITDLDVTKTPIAHLTGTNSVTFTDPEKQKLADFLNKGGVLLVDPTAGNTAFAASFKDALATMFADPLTEIPAASPLLTGSMPGGAHLKDLETRLFNDNPENRKRLVTFFELKLHNKPALLFSHADLTAGLAGLRTWGILGYTPATTTALTWNALLYLSPPPPPPPPPPAAAPPNPNP